MKKPSQGKVFTFHEKVWSWDGCSATRWTCSGHNTCLTQSDPIDQMKSVNEELESVVSRRRSPAILDLLTYKALTSCRG